MQATTGTTTHVTAAVAVAMSIRNTKSQSDMNTLSHYDRDTNHSPHRIPDRLTPGNLPPLTEPHSLDQRKEHTEVHCDSHACQATQTN